MIKQKYREIILGSVIICGMLLQMICMITHFTHFDDVGLLTSILSLGDDFVSRMDYRIFGWTYAPLQCVIISLLIDGEYSYALNLFLGRLPSLVFSCLNIVLLLKILQKSLCKKENEFLIKLLGIILLAFSWESLIYASQAEPYSVAVTGVLLLIYNQYVIHESQKIQIWKLAIAGALVCYANYQLFIFVFCFYVSLFIPFILRKNWNDFLKALIASIGSFILCLPLLKSFFMGGFFERGLNWNRGIDSQYVFDSALTNGNALYPISFFLRNTTGWYRNFFVFNTNTWWADTLAVFLVILSVIGIIYVHQKRLFFSVFLDLCLVLNGVMILLGRLTFSPSRHTLVLMPFAILLICYGSIGLQDMIGKNRESGIKIFLLLIILAKVGTFLVYFPEEYSIRKNQISQQMVDDLIDEYNPQIVCFYGDTFDLDLMHFADYSKQTEGGLVDQYICKNNQEVQPGDRILYFSRCQKITEHDLHLINDNLGQHSLHFEYADERDSDIEVEYARNVFSNYRNGYYLYLYTVME